MCIFPIMGREIQRAQSYLERSGFIMDMGALSLIMLVAAIAIGFFLNVNVGLVSIFFAVILDMEVDSSQEKKSSPVGADRCS